MLHTKLTKAHLQDLDSRTARRIQRKTDQIQGVKLLLAMTLFIGAIMETPMPKAGTAKVSLDCPLIERIKSDYQGTYTVREQSCAWTFL